MTFPHIENFNTAKGFVHHEDGFLTDHKMNFPSKPAECTANLSFGFPHTALFIRLPLP